MIHTHLVTFVWPGKGSMTMVLFRGRILIKGVNYGYGISKTAANCVMVILASMEPMYLSNMHTRYTGGQFIGIYFLW